MNTLYQILILEVWRHFIRVFRHIKVTFKKKLLVEYTSKSSSYE